MHLRAITQDMRTIIKQRHRKTYASSNWQHDRIGSCVHYKIMDIFCRF